MLTALIPANCILFAHVTHGALGAAIAASSLSLKLFLPSLVQVLLLLQEQQQKQGGKRPEESEHAVAAATGQQELVNR